MQGYSVRVEPDDGEKLNYLSQKGWQETLSDPVFLFVIGIPLALLLNLISNWLYDHLKRTPEPNDASLVLEYAESGNRVRYNHSGQQISEERFRAILSSLDERKHRFAESQKITSPDPAHPYPVHLEHTPKIIGWAQDIYKDDIGIRLDGIKIVDDETWQRIQSGELTGLSPGGVITSSVCQICKRDYIDCNHIAGETYEGEECTVWIASMCIAEFSIVKEPAQPLAKLHITR